MPLSQNLSVNKLLTLIGITIMGIKDNNMKNGTKSKKFEKFNIDSLVYCC